MNNIITKIEIGKRNKNRVNIFINEEFSFACSADLVYYYSLEKGKTVDLELLKDIVIEDSYIKGKTDALRSIERSYKSEKEVVEKLLGKGYEEKVIIRIIDFLKQYNFVDDKKYAQMFIKDKSTSLGRNKIKYMLQKKGIEDDIIEEEIATIEESFEEQAALKELAEKRYTIVCKLENDKAKINRKLSEYLIRRGYNWEEIKKVLKEIVEDE